MKPGARLAASLVSLGVVVFVGALVASWAQDAIAPWRNVGEAETGSPITFHAADTTYRVLACAGSGGNRHADVGRPEGFRLRPAARLSTLVSATSSKRKRINATLDKRLTSQTRWMVAMIVAIPTVTVALQALVN